MAQRAFVKVDSTDYGPFDVVRFEGADPVFLYVDSDNYCAKFDAQGWHVTNGEDLGDSGLTGTNPTIILGQAKIVQ